MKIMRGVTRTVLLTRRYAIKVPRLKDCRGHRMWTFCRGVLANQSEILWHEYANTNYSTPQVVPVLKSLLGGIINIYPRVKIEWVEDDMYTMADKIEFQTPSDFHVGNLGWYEGYPVWTDYDMNWNDCKRCGIIM